eukprot:TRINITY_DN37246_c0_g1_i1.p1 TRINITY_DN37246_c0_g1~~TRINITY_DN37246_c0_g1_i1.p1  ORF type:complete len:654 (-),score=119.26 TRINITY_DN37246_c0_g1_i1:162-2123(-)
MNFFFSFFFSIVGAVLASPVVESDPVAEEVFAYADTAPDAQSSALMSALTEAAYTLAAFLAAAAVIHMFQQRNARNVRARSLAQKTKFLENMCSSVQASAAAAAPTPGQKTFKARDRPQQPEPMLPVLRRPPATATAGGAVATAGQRRGAAAPCSSSSFVGLVELDSLAAAVRNGRAWDLPGLLDAARARAVAAGYAGEALADLAGQHLQTSLRSCAARRCFREALHAYDHAAQREGDCRCCSGTWSVLLYCAVEAQQLLRCPSIIRELLGGSDVVSSNDFVNMLRFYAINGDLEELQRTIATLRDRGFVLDTISRNRALSACTANRALRMAELLVDGSIPGDDMDIIGFNTLMKCYMQAGLPEKCFELYSKLREENLKPSEVTYGILLDACNDSGDVERAKEVFSELRDAGARMNVIHYTTFMKVLAKDGQLECINALLEEMLKSPSTKPDLVTYSTIVKANAEKGQVSSALRVLESMKGHGVIPDNVIFHLVLSGCVVEPMESRFIAYVLQRLVSYGLKCHTTTLSILIKAYARKQDWDAALDMLENAQDRFGVWPEARLYAQLAQSCANLNQGSRVLEIYVAMVRSASKRGFVVDDQSNSRLHRLCVSCGVARMGAKIHSLASRRAECITAQELDSLVADCRAEASTWTR